MFLTFLCNFQFNIFRNVSSWLRLKVVILFCVCDHKEKFQRLLQLSLLNQIKKKEGVKKRKYVCVSTTVILSVCLQFQ